MAAKTRVSRYEHGFLCACESDSLPSSQERNFNTVLDVLTLFRASEVEKAVQGLNKDQLDILIKYIYRGFAYPTENSCGILLVWHEKVGADCTNICHFVQ